MSARSWSWVVIAVFGVATLVAVVLLTPWRPTEAPPAPVGMQPDPHASAARDFSTTELARAASYAHQIRPPMYLGMVLGLIVALIVGLTPLGSKLITALTSGVSGWGWQVIIGALALCGLGFVLTVPFAARAHAIRRQYGRSSQSWTGWSVDQAKSLALSAVIYIAIALIIVGLIRWLPRTWPLVAASAALVVGIGMSFLIPVVIEPIFFRFTPLPDSPLRTELIRMADREGVTVSEVLVADASRRTTAINAYVSGLGSTRRIVLYDTLLEKVPESEVRVIVAHELAHARYHDVLRTTVIVTLAAGLSAGVVGVVLSSGWLLQRAGVTTAGDPHSLGLVAAVVAVLMAVSTPLQTVVSRRVETRADIAALATTSDTLTFAQMQRNLALRNVSDPQPPRWVATVFATHPSATQRIELSRAWARALGVPEPPGQAP